LPATKPKCVPDVVAAAEVTVRRGSDVHVSHDVGCRHRLAVRRGADVERLVDVAEALAERLRRRDVQRRARGVGRKRDNRARTVAVDLAGQVDGEVVAEEVEFGLERLEESTARICGQLDTRAADLCAAVQVLELVDRVRIALRRRNRQRAVLSTRTNPARAATMHRDDCPTPDQFLI